MPIQFQGKPIELKYVDDPGVREVYADQSRLLNYDGTAVHVEFVIVRPELTSARKVEQRFVTSARLVISLQGAVTLYAQLSDLVSQLEKAGTLPKQNAPSSGKNQ